MLFFNLLIITLLVFAVTMVTILAFDMFYERFYGRDFVADLKEWWDRRNSGSKGRY